MEIYTKFGLRAILEGKDTTQPKFIHGIVYEDDKPVRVIWHEDGSTVGKLDKYKRYDLYESIRDVELPVFELKPIEKPEVSFVI